MARDVRALHSRPPASSEGVKTSTTSALQSPPPISPSLPSPSKAVPKVAGDEQTKEDALAVKASEALARVKLGDAEVAINSAKEEVGRARAEAEQAKAEAKQAKAEAKQAKADAQAARDAEVSPSANSLTLKRLMRQLKEACSSPASRDWPVDFENGLNAPALLKPLKMSKTVRYQHCSASGPRFHAIIRDY